MPAPYRLAGRYHEPWTDREGNGLTSGSVTVYVAGTSTLATLYTSSTKATTAANPVTAAGTGSKLDDVGNLTLFADPGVYDTVTTIGGVTGSVVTIFVDINPDEVAQLDDDGRVLSTQSAAGTVADGSVTTLKLADGAVTDAKVATGIAQSKVVNLTADLAAKLDAAEKGAANGVPNLDADSKVPAAQLPSIALSDTFVVDTEAEMLALAAQTGDVAIRTDLSKSFILTATPASTLANWEELLSPTSPVQSVNGRTGVVTGLAESTDPRLTDQRTPTDGSVTNAKVAAAAAIAESKLALASDAAADVASRRTLGTGALQAAPGTLGATGTADATTFLRGDRVWAVPVGGGTSEALVRRFDGDATGATDVTAALNSFLATGLPGETLQFARNGRYLINTDTSLLPPNGVEVDGNGAMFFTTASIDGVAAERTQAFWEPANRHNVTLRRMRVFGFRRNVAYGTDTEVQTVDIPDATTGGTFTLTYSGQTTAAIAHNATGAAVASALNALSTITSAGGVTGGAGPLPGTAVTVAFNVAGARSLITGNGTGLTPSGAVTVVRFTPVLYSVNNNMLSKTQSDGESQTGLQGWTAVNGTRTTTTTNPIVGARSWQLNADGGTTAVIGQTAGTMAALTAIAGDVGGPTADESYRAFVVEAGIQYRATCLAQPVATARDYSLQINWYTDTAATASATPAFSESPVVAGDPADPVELSVAAVAAPTGAIRARVQFNVRSTSALPVNEKHNFDRVTFHRNAARTLTVSGSTRTLTQSGDELRLTKPDTASNLSGMWSRVAYGQPTVVVNRIEAGSTLTNADVVHPPDGNYAFDLQLSATTGVAKDCEIRILSADGTATLARRILTLTTTATWYRLTYTPRDIHEVVQVSVRKVTSTTDTITVHQTLEFGRISHTVNEGYHAFNVIGGSTNVHIEDVFGEGTCDLIRIGGDNNNSNITMRHFFGRGSNRQGLDVAGGKYVLIENGIISEAVFTSLDIETDSPERFVENVTLRNIDCFNGGSVPNACIAAKGWSHHKNLVLENVHCITDHPGTGKMIEGGAIGLTLNNVTMTRGANATDTSTDFDIHGQEVVGRGLFGPNGLALETAGRRAEDANGRIVTHYDRNIDVECVVTSTGGQAKSLIRPTTTTGGGTVTATSGLAIPVVDGTALGDTNGKTIITDAATTNGSKTLTAPSGPFTATDASTRRQVGGPGIPHNVTIEAFVSATEVTLSKAATATATGVTIAKASSTRVASIGSASSSINVTYVGISGNTLIGGTLDTGTGTFAAGDVATNFAENARAQLRFAGKPDLFVLTRTGLTTAQPLRKAGVPVDADFPQAPRDGTRAVDITNNRDYVRLGGVWTNLLDVTHNTQTASYTLVLADAGKVVEMNVAGANTLTVPPNSSVAFPIGTVIGWRQYGAGQTTLTPGSGVTIRSSGAKLKSGAQYAEGTLTKRATDEWVAGGDLSA